MDRRRFIALTRIAATAAPVVRSGPSLATGTRWQPDGVGSLARIGILTPDFDPVPESEIWAMAPHGVSIHAARVPRKGAEAPPGSAIRRPKRRRRSSRCAHEREDLGSLGPAERQPRRRRAGMGLID